MKKYLLFALVVYLCSCEINRKNESKENSKKNTISNSPIELIYKSNQNRLLDLDKIITIEKDSIKTLFNRTEKKIVYFFPFSACDVCEVDVFKEILDTELIVKNSIVLVPLNSLRDFKKFNTEYKLNFEKIYGYKGELLKKQELVVSRGLFFILSKNYKITNIYIPDKPIKKGALKRYFDNFINNN